MKAICCFSTRARNARLTHPRKRPQHKIILAAGDSVFGVVDGVCLWREAGIPDEIDMIAKEAL